MRRLPRVIVPAATDIPFPGRVSWAGPGKGDSVLHRGNKNPSGVRPPVTHTTNSGKVPDFPLIVNLATLSRAPSQVGGRPAACAPPLSISEWCNPRRVAGGSPQSGAESIAGALRIHRVEQARCAKGSAATCNGERPGQIARGSSLILAATPGVCASGLGKRSPPPAPCCRWPRLRRRFRCPSPQPCEIDGEYAACGHSAAASLSPCRPPTSPPIHLVARCGVSIVLEIQGQSLSVVAAPRRFHLY